MSRRHHPSHKRKRFVVICEQGKHQMPQEYFDVHLSEKRIILSRKDEFRARVNPRYTTWIETESGRLMFRVKDSPVAPYSISSSWLALFRAFNYQAPFFVYYRWWAHGEGERPDIY